MYPNFTGYPTGYQNVLPPQQILQANGKASIDLSSRTLGLMELVTSHPFLAAVVDKVTSD